jgi:hypothetical protein
VYRFDIRRLHVLCNRRHEHRRRDVKARPVARGGGRAYRRVLVVVPVISILDRRNRKGGRGLMISRDVCVNRCMRNRHTSIGKTEEAGGHRRENSEETGPGHPPNLRDRPRRRVPHGRRSSITKRVLHLHEKLV